ncbi:MAG TPA: metallophosphoesterase [Acidiferrobacterales bacterium]|nr:metallophosphoesterase [Acidiferrobacterales bacterium]
MRSPELTPEEKAVLANLEPRLGRLHVRQRLGLENDYEARVFRKGTHFFHLENWYSVHSLIRNSLRLVGLHDRGRRNALAIQVRENEIVLPNLPHAFDGFTLLQLTDLHVDMNREFVHTLIEVVRSLDYDLCVLTGDYRARTFGPFQPTLDGLQRLRVHLKNTTYAVLGNHDTIRMAPGMEEMGYRLLINEQVTLHRDGEAIYLAGIDDAHYYHMENFHRAAHDIPAGACSILLSHTPEAYRHAAHADFNLMLCGHTHGGQICLPGGVPLLTDADCPRALARGAWKHHDLIGYTSVGAGSCIVDVRLNCPPEVTLHRLVCS